MQPLKKFEEQTEEENCLTDELSRLYGGGLSFPQPSTDRPYSVINFVTTIEGLTSFAIPGKAGGGHISGFSSEDAFVMGLLRAFADGVAVGANTLRSEPDHIWTADYISADHRELFQELRQKLGKTKPYPVSIFFTGSGKVFVDNSYETVPATFTNPDIETLIVTTTKGASRIEEEFNKRNLVPSILIAEEKGRPNEVDLQKAMGELKRKYSVEFLLIEGGSTFNGSIIDSGLYDEVFLTVAPQIIGTSKEKPRPTFVQGFTRDPENAIWHALASVKIVGDYEFKRYIKK